MSGVKLSTIAGVFAWAATVYAHGHVSSFTVGGKVIEGGINGGLGRNPKPNTAAWMANNMDNGFVSSPSSPDIICHNGAEPGTSSVTVAAGETITITWNTWPDSHAGPVIDYLAPVSGEFASVNKASLAFVKIAEKGLTGTSWAARELIANGFNWAVKIPSSVAPGNYILRHEMLALHEGQRVGGTQFYPQCVNIVVTGSGTNALSGGTLGTQLYGANEPGVIFDMYQGATTYPIPGPKLMAGGGGAVQPVPGAGTTQPAPGATTTTSSVPAPTTLTTSVITTTAPTGQPQPPTCGGGSTGGNGNGATAPRYAQCGGQGYSGPTACESGLTCTVQNPYYSQCL